jgi:hypothetical protein
LVVAARLRRGLGHGGATPATPIAALEATQPRSSICPFFIILDLVQGKRSDVGTRRARGMQGNRVGAAGFAVLVEALPRWPKLETLVSNSRSR